MTLSEALDIERALLLELNRLSKLAAAKRRGPGEINPGYAWALRAASAADRRYKIAVRATNEARAKETR